MRLMGKRLRSTKARTRGSRRGAGRHALEERFWHIEQRLSAVTGQAFFRELVENLARTLPVDFALIGELGSPNGTAPRRADGQAVLASRAAVIHTAAVYGDGDWLGNFTYDLTGTPCAHVVSGGACCYPRGVGREFPADRWLIEQGIESYVGVPLLDAGGTSLGLLAVLHRAALARPKTVQQALRTFAARAASELARKRVEDALRQNEEWSRRIVDAVPGGIVIITPDGAVQQCNPEGLRILGMTHARMTSRRVLDWAGETIHEDGSPCPVDDYPGTKCLRTGQPQPGQTIGVRRPDGSVSWAVYSAVPLNDPATGKLVAAVVTFFDVTERRRSEERLRKSEEFHRLISEVASDYAYSGPLDANGVFHFEELTEGFTRVTGYTFAEIQAKGGWMALIHADDLAGTADNIQRLRRGEDLDAEVRIVTRAGETRWIRFTSRPVWDAFQGRVTRLVGAVHDITERKQ